jgi:hypothetical protein
MAGGFQSAVVARLEALGGGAEAIEFVEWLVACGRSSYTVRTYASGLAHFLGWLEGRRAGLVEVDRGVVADYVAEFARGERAGLAVGRAPATVNHRVSVLASFFGWLLERDRDAGTGCWSGRISPVPPGAVASPGGHGMRGRDAVRYGRRGELRRRVPQGTHRLCPARSRWGWRSVSSIPRSPPPG